MPATHVGKQLVAELPLENQVPEAGWDQIGQMVLAQPERSARQLAWPFADQEGYSASESSAFGGS